MKKLNKLVLNKAKIMSVREMKNITGGYDGIECAPGQKGYYCTAVWSDGSSTGGTCCGVTSQDCRDQVIDNFYGWVVDVSCLF